MSTLKIDKILQDNENCIGTCSKSNALILKNNQSTIINLQDSGKKGSHWVSYKKICNEIFQIDSYGIAFIPDIMKINIQIINLFVIFIEFNQLILTNVDDSVYYLLNQI